MRILLYECLPARLRRDLLGLTVQTESQTGWAGVKNGRLLRLIAGSGNYDAFLTMDKSLPHQQRVEELPFAVLVLRTVSNRNEDTHPLMPEVLRRMGEFQPGRLFTIGG